MMALTQAERTQRWRTKNKERVNANQREYKKANRGIYTADQNRRRKGVAERTPPWADLAEITNIYKQSASLSKLLGRKTHVDHIIPLHGKNVSGLHVPANMQIMFADDNLRKGNKHG